MSKQIPIEKIALPADIKLVNRQKILEVFKTGEKRTATDVRAATGISKPTIMRALQYFCDEGILESAGLGLASSVGGKKPEYFVFADKRKILCIALWPNVITLALSGIVGDVYAISHYEHKLEKNPADVFDSLRKISTRYLAERDVLPECLYGVVLSTSGTVDYKTNVLRYNSQSPSWGRNISVVDYLKPIFGETLEYLVENAGKTTGRSVLLDYPSLKNGRVITLFSTWGISACLIENGRILNGRDSLIGEIGHMTIDGMDGDLCGCGKRGCLEKLVNREKIRRMLAETGVMGFGDEKAVTFQNLFEASKNENPEARRVVKYLAHCFAVALHNLSLVYNPNAVIFQGDYAGADEYFDICLKQELNEFQYYPKKGAFNTFYDNRDLAMLAARGGALMMKKRYFSELDVDY